MFMNNRLKKILILILSVTIGMLIYFGFISIPCVFHTLFKIPCPGCGMTRAFFRIINFDFIGAFYYNILGIPLFIFLIFCFVSIIYDIVLDKKTLENKVLKFLEKFAIPIILLLVVSMVVNIFRGI